MNAPRFVIVGDGAAGLTAAQRLREKSPLSPITLLSDDPHPAYYRAALTNYLLGELADHQVWAVSPAFFQDYRLERILTRVTALDGQRRCLHLANGAVQPYEGLLIASGAHARPPAFEGAQLGGVWSFRTLHDARGMLDAISSGRLQRAVIIGGGPLAIEWAMAMVERGVAATMLVRGGRVMEREIDATGSDLVVARMKLAGVDVRTHEEVHGAVAGPNGYVTAVVTKRGEQIPCQLVGAAIGVIPNTYFLGSSGVTLGKGGGVAVDERMRTSLPGVYAAGDVAERDGALLQLWEPARRQALVAADNMTGGDSRFEPGAHYFATRLADLDFASVGAVHTEPDMQPVVARSQKTGTMAYRKLLLREGKLVGALMLGQRSENVRRAGRAFKRLIDERIDVWSIKDSLLDAQFDLNSWLRGRALVTKPKPANPKSEQVAPAAQLRGTQMVRMPPALAGGQAAVGGALAAAAAAAGAAAVGAKQDAPKLTIGLPMATAAVMAPAVERVVARLEGAEGTWPLDRQIATVGASERCDITITDAWASQVHAEIRLHNDEHFVRDMGSDAGTWINGSPLTVAHRLTSGDTLQIGHAQLRYVKEGQQATAKGPVVAERRVPMLEVRRGPGVGLRFALSGGKVTVGREPQSSLRLDDVQVSRRHAVLTEQHGQWFVCDLHSSRGTYKNGSHLRPGEEAPLAEGDQVQFGDSLLVMIRA